MNNALLIQMDVQPIIKAAVSHICLQNRTLYLADTYRFGLRSIVTGSLGLMIRCPSGRSVFANVYIQSVSRILFSKKDQRTLTSLVFSLIFLPASLLSHSPLSPWETWGITRGMIIIYIFFLNYIWVQVSVKRGWRIFKMRWFDGERDLSLSLKVIWRNDVISVPRLACGGLWLWWRCRCRLPFSEAYSCAILH